MRLLLEHRPGIGPAGRGGEIEAEFLFRGVADEGPEESRFCCERVRLKPNAVRLKWSTKFGAGRQAPVWSPPSSRPLVSHRHSSVTLTPARVMSRGSKIANSRHVLAAKGLKW
jgi:hypothetical protein